MQDLISMWAIQESLLQSYRSMFITAQSVVFALGATVATLNPGATIAMASLGFILLSLWKNVCRKRALDVTFFQWLILRTEDGAKIPDPMTIFKSFQDGKIITVGGKNIWKVGHPELDAAVSKHTLDILFEEMLASDTRKRMEKWLPIVFIILWFFVVVFAVYRMYCGLTSACS